jgi:hypothetical protein
MYRSTRNTSDWFDQDKKGAIIDRDQNRSVGPGLYNSQASILGDKTKKISHNIGSVSFGTRQKGHVDVFQIAQKNGHVPGVGAYE